MKHHVPFLLALVSAVWGQGAWAESSERAELKRERNVIEAEYARREQACREQFVVTPCLETVRRERNEALSTVKAREGALDSAERLERAQSKKQRLTDKAASSDTRAASAAQAASVPKDGKARPAPSPRKEAKPRPDPSERKAKEEASRAAYAERQREIQAHRDEVLKRNAAKAGRPAQPLPPPASAASAASAASGKR